MYDDDDYYGSRFSIFSYIFDRGDFIIVPALIALVTLPIVLYIVARARQAREPFTDPQLGLKFALSYFKLIAYHVLLVGGVMLAFAILMKSKEKSDVYRPAFGLVVPAAMVLGAHVWALFRTNQEEFPLVPRLMQGWSLVISAAFGFLGLLMVSHYIFQKGSAGEPGRFAWALFLVYGSAWIVQAVRYYRSAWNQTLGTAMAPYYPPPPGAMPGVPYPEAGMPGAPGMPSPFTPPSPFAPPHPGYAPPPPSPFAPAAEGVPTEASGSPFAPPPQGSGATVASTTPAPAPSPFAPGAAPPGPSPFAPPGRTPTPAPASTPQPGSVPLPAPMAQPLAPPGSAPSTTPSGYPGGDGGSGTKR